MKRTRFVIVFLYRWGSLVAQTVKNLLAMWKIWVQSLGREDPLEKGMATQSSILAWRIPWTEEPGGLQSMGSQRVGHIWATKHPSPLPVLFWEVIYVTFSVITVFQKSTSRELLWSSVPYKSLCLHIWLISSLHSPFSPFSFPSLAPYQGGFRSDTVAYWDFLHAGPMSLGLQPPKRLTFLCKQGHLSELPLELDPLTQAALVPVSLDGKERGLGGVWHRTPEPTSDGHFYPIITGLHPHGIKLSLFLTLFPSSCRKQLWPQAWHFVKGWWSLSGFVCLFLNLFI